MGYLFVIIIFSLDPSHAGKIENQHFRGQRGKNTYEFRFYEYNIIFLICILMKSNVSDFLGSVRTLSDLILPQKYTDTTMHPPSSLQVIS